jgi:hypothetical protein
VQKKLWEMTEEFLLANGYKEVPCKSTGKQYSNGTNNIFVGPNNSIRTGKSKSNSHDIHYLVWPKVLTYFEKKLGIK